MIQPGVANDAGRQQIAVQRHHLLARSSDYFSPNNRKSCTVR